ALWRGRRVYHRDFWALRNVTFRVRGGSTLGIIGMNGSGKSTLLQVIAGIVQPTQGRVTVRGRVASLPELGAGFNPEFTGRENVVMQGTVMGFPPEEFRDRLPSIAAFAEIGDFIDQPVKTYSSGMFVRLAFAAAIHVDPDILLVDEALAVGDAAFQHRCISKIKEFQRQGKTIAFVSHDMALVKAICTDAALLHAGRAVKIGPPGDIVSFSHGAVSTAAIGLAPPAAPRAPDVVHAKFRPDPAFDRRSGLFRHGSGAARIRNVELLDAAETLLSTIAF